MARFKIWGGGRKVRERFSKEISSGIISLHIESSLTFLKSCPSKSLDFIYIDTDHSYNTTIQELRESNRVISEDGYIAGHDYTVGNINKKIPYGVKKAVKQFLIEFNYKFVCLTVEEDGYNSFVIKKMRS